MPNDGMYAPPRRNDTTSPERYRQPLICLASVSQQAGVPLKYE